MLDDMNEETRYTSFYVTWRDITSCTMVVNDGEKISKLKISKLTREYFSQMVFIKILAS